MRDYKHAVLINDDDLNFLEMLDGSNVTYVDFDAYGINKLLYSIYRDFC